MHILHQKCRKKHCFYIFINDLRPNENSRIRHQGYELHEEY